jgi:hypothetical protein
MPKITVDLQRADGPVTVEVQYSVMGPEQELEVEFARVDGVEITLTEQEHDLVWQVCGFDFEETRAASEEDMRATEDAGWGDSMDEGEADDIFERDGYDA